MAKGSVEAGDRERLAMTVLFEREERLIWAVSEPGRGHVLEVEVDDLTAEVVRVGYVGIR